ncbi:MAG TPA: MaoC family dehydratase [Usitatibacteraceae bacterium]|nr:MaoC family dehydratase [Usitatibacteraceae bacterium]
MRPANGYFFEDYAVGQAFDHAVPRTITQGDCALYQALTGSRNPLHCSEPFAQLLGYPAMPVDDLLVFHIAFGKTVPDISWNAVANLGYADCRFVRPVFIGDTLRAQTTILGLKPNSSGKSGVVYVRSSAYNQRDELVLTWVRWVMVHRRAAAGGAAPGEGCTAFADSVDAGALRKPLKAAAGTTVARATGSDRFWEDYAADAEIRHPAGMTLDETDHTLATKLYQNTARVHFDLKHMQSSRFGKRLVYGGQVISICRALSFDGLENALSILAINGGSHLNPTFAGDTLYAVSRVLGKWPVDAHHGALRLALFGYKNVDPASAEFNDNGEAQKVLSLDYTVLMPRRGG